MYVLEDIGWGVLTSVFFILFHFLFEKALHFRKIVALNINYWNLEVISGLYYSVTSLAIELFIWNFNRDFLIPIGIITSAILITLRSSTAAVINIFPSLIFNALTFNITDMTYVMYAIVFSGMITYVIFDFIIPKALVSKITLSLTITIVSFIAYFVFLSGNVFNGRELYEQTLVLGLLCILDVTIVSYFMSVSKSANILFDSVNYVYLSYYRHAVALVTIADLIQKKKITHGVFGVFRHTMADEVPYETQKNISKVFLAEFEKKVPKDAIVFFIEQNVHGIFLPASSGGDINYSVEGNALPQRYAGDLLKNVEKLFSKSEKEYIDEFGQSAFVKLKVGASIYGLQDSSLSKLEENALFALNSFNSRSQNIISLFEPKLLKDVMNDSQKLLNLDYALKLDNFENMFRGIYSKTKIEPVGVLSWISNISEFNLNGSIREHIRFNGWKSEFDRYFAIDTLNEYINSPISKVMFDYSPLLLNQDLDFKALKNKVLKLGVNPSQITLVIDEAPVEKWQFENLAKAQELEFEIACFNITEKAILDKVKPSWVIISPKHFGDRLGNYKSRTIFADINSMENLRVAKSRGASYYSGALFGEENSIKNFDISTKQSKILLKELIGGSAEGVKHE